MTTSLTCEYDADINTPAVCLASVRRFKIKHESAPCQLVEGFPLKYGRPRGVTQFDLLQERGYNSSCRYAQVSWLRLLLINEILLNTRISKDRLSYAKGGNVKNNWCNPAFYLLRSSNSNFFDIIDQCCWPSTSLAVHSWAPISWPLTWHMYNLTTATLTHK